MSPKILLINLCEEKLHYYEFVRPIEDILRSEKISFFTKNYRAIQTKDLEMADKIILCGTSLKDNEFVKPGNFEKLSWIKSFDKPLLGICAGMQVISRIFGGKNYKKTEIGFYEEDFKKDFFGLIGKQEVYHLHNHYPEVSNIDKFQIICSSDITQAFKHKEKKIYGVLFHPEVRQKELILRFCKTNS